MGEIRSDGTFDPRVKGIYTLTMEHIFKRIQQFSDRDFRVRVTFLEIYNEKIKDLLRDPAVSGDEKNDEKRYLEVQEDPVKGIVVQDLTEYEVTNVEKIQEIILRGNS